MLLRQRTHLVQLPLHLPSRQVISRLTVATGLRQTILQISSSSNLLKRDDLYPYPQYTKSDNNNNNNNNNNLHSCSSKTDSSNSRSSDEQNRDRVNKDKNQPLRHET